MDHLVVWLAHFLALDVQAVHCAPRNGYNARILPMILAKRRLTPHPKLKKYHIMFPNVHLLHDLYASPAQGTVTQLHHGLYVDHQQKVSCCRFGVCFQESQPPPSPLVPVEAKNTPNKTNHRIYQHAKITRYIHTIRATQKNRMSIPVSSRVVGKNALKSSWSTSGQLNTENGNSPELNQVSSTSSSWLRQT